MKQSQDANLKKLNAMFEMLKVKLYIYRLYFVDLVDKVWLKI